MQIKSNMEKVKQHNLRTGTPLSIFKMSSEHKYLKMVLLMYYHLVLLHIEDLSHSAVDIFSCISFLQNVCMHAGSRNLSPQMTKSQMIVSQIA